MVLSVLLLMQMIKEEGEEWSFEGCSYIPDVREDVYRKRLLLKYCKKIL
jgi:hypothetical protein